MRVREGYRRIYHYHVPKTGGTSLNYAFWNLGGLDGATFGTCTAATRNGLTYVRHDRELIEAGRYFFGNSHLPMYRAVVPPNTFTVTILREPLGRLRSLYRHLLFIRDDPSAREKEPYFDSLQRKTVWLGDDFSDFLTRVPRKYLLAQLNMFSEGFDTDEAIGRIRSLSAICFTETLGADLAGMSRRLGLKLVERNERKFGPMVELRPEELGQAREALAAEYHLVRGVAERLERPLPW